MWADPNFEGGGGGQVRPSEWGRLISHASGIPIEMRFFSAASQTLDALRFIAYGTVCESDSRVGAEGFHKPHFKKFPHYSDCVVGIISKMYEAVLLILLLMYTH